MLPLKDVLITSNRASAITDLSENFTATREGNWVKIVHVRYDPQGKPMQATYSSFYGLENADKIESLPKGWVAVGLK